MLSCEKGYRSARLAARFSEMNLCYRIGWHFFRSLFRFYFGWQVVNAERVPVEGPVILVSNHASILDPPLLGSGLQRQISYLGRQSLFKIPVFGAILRSWKVVPVDRDGGTGRGLKAVLERLREGGMVVLFPEGTRTPDGQLQAPRAGVGLAVIRSKAAVVPARVFGTFEAFNRRAILPRPRRRVSVKYGFPMMFEKLRAEAENCPKERLKEIYHEVAEETMREIGKLEAD
jgi:1-acyl-sn-glycerol-3-phosphate acyltransferase